MNVGKNQNEPNYFSLKSFKENLFERVPFPLKLNILITSYQNNKDRNKLKWLCSLNTVIIDSLNMRNIFTNK